MAFEPVTALLDLGTKLIERLFPNPEQKAAAMQKLMEMQQSGDLAVIAGQTEINKIEAANANLFVSGWRPAVGWVCVSGLFMSFVGGPFFTWGAALAHSAIVFPTLPLDILLTLLVGMLGLGGMRTVERLNGVART